MAGDGGGGGDAVSRMINIHMDYTIQRKCIYSQFNSINFFVAQYYQT